MLPSDLLTLSLSIEMSGNQSTGEEQDDVDDAEGPSSLLHAAVLLDSDSPSTVVACTDAVSVAVKVDRSAVPARAVGLADATEVVNTGDEGSEHEQIDKGDEHGDERVAFELEECDDGPGGSDNSDDEEDEDFDWWSDSGIGVFVHEVCEHTPYRDEGDYLDKSEEEEDC